VQNIKVIHTPICAPNANAYAERWVRTVRQECLDHLIIVNERHLNSVLREYVDTTTSDGPIKGSNRSPLKIHLNRSIQERFIGMRYSAD
jgi:putative transposase